ncbi:MAG: hypothetical protein LBS86_07465 [Treponema sp.]|nr:hypothetical protein [Treponema sp.]
MRRSVQWPSDDPSYDRVPKHAERAFVEALSLSLSKGLLRNTCRFDRLSDRLLQSSSADYGRRQVLVMVGGAAPSTSGIVKQPVGAL